MSPAQSHFVCLFVIVNFIVLNNLREPYAQYDSLWFYFYNYDLCEQLCNERQKHDTHFRGTTVHCDIKSANIVLDEMYNGRLTDFGLARDIGPKSSAQTTSIHGKTAAYRPTWASDETLSTVLDVFALCIGVLIY